MNCIMCDVPFTLRINSTDEKFIKNADGYYYNESNSVKVEVILNNSLTVNTTCQKNTVTNISNESIILSGFSSAKINTAKGVIGVDRNRWQSEGQWTFLTAMQCGLIPATTHEWEKEIFNISSVGSWSTGVYYPLSVVLGEDGYAYYMEIEGAHNWQLTHSVSGGIRAPRYQLEATAANEENGGWCYTLLPGESYTTETAFFGRVKGGIEAVAKELVDFRRKTSLAENSKMPVVFNDYMNCLWAKPSREKLLPLIDAAAKVGCEYFCIDDGWFKSKNPFDGSWGSKPGDWIVDNEKFGDDGLDGIFAYMKQKGLTPGVWFEFDTVNAETTAHYLDDDCLLKRYGKTITRSFFNFRNAKVKKFIRSRVAELYGMGVRYIKNDYNQTTGIGTDNYGEVPAEGLIRNYKAFVEFIDELRLEFKDLIIENCGSGAMRAENGTLKHFHLQSTSDQEIYYYNPSIIIGSALQYTPEKAGIWSYPFPQTFDERLSLDPNAEWLARFADGEETVFNMVNGMCGSLYQSGRLDLCDEKNLKLVADGIAAFKEMRGDIITSHPIMPTGTCLIGENCVAAFGLECKDKSKAYLAVWRIGMDDETVEINLKKYGYKKATPWYPQDTSCELVDGILKVHLLKKYSARMILLQKN